MERSFRVVIAVLAAIALFLLIQFGALALVEPFDAAGLRPVEDPENPTNPFLYVGAVLVATVLMLGAFRYGLDILIRGGIIIASAMLAWFALDVVIPPVVVLADVNLFAATGAALIGVGLYVHPEWYVIDAAGVLIGATAAGLFGITFGILPALLLLITLAVYDAISVYGTKHMLSLADGVMDVKVPVLLIVPLSLSYSFLSNSGPESQSIPAGADDEGEGTVETAEETGSEGDGSFIHASPLDRDALFIGLGDAVIPAILVASAAFYVPSPVVPLLGISLTIPALAAMVGTVLGLLVLLRMVLAGRPHAGLPLLCGGAIAGYLLGALAVGIPLTEAIGVAPYL